MKLELGSGHRGTPGYMHSDINAFDGIDLVGKAWELDLPDESVEEILALSVMEHFSYDHFALALANVRRMLAPGGRFFFDVPNLPIWGGYLAKIARGKQVPFTRKQIYDTIYGWQRWAGDTHRSGWDRETLAVALDDAGFLDIDYGVEHFIAHSLHRVRFGRPANAHIYVVAHK